jgi:DNA-directed RNA polymerase specialized sigma24 family protein
MSGEIDTVLLAAQQALRDLERQTEQAHERRAIAFALAAEKGKTSGDIARLVGTPPATVRYAIQNGARLIRRRRWLDEGRAA